jgi:ribosomal protein S12 methylthiotransferase accessory factor
MQRALATALAVATSCGVTRLADVTGLDRIGLPVWQAIRPFGRSLSVHQGKGLDAWQARLGACMEAIECSHAEAWTAPMTRARWTDLPVSDRAPAADDFAGTRGDIAADTPIEWVSAERLDAGRLWVPAGCVSLDLTQPVTPGLERSSNGQGAGFDLHRATQKGLCEIIERDAVAAWQAGDLVSRRTDEIAAASIGFDWFKALLSRCQALGISMRVYRLRAVIAIPAVAVELIDTGGEAIACPHAGGTAVHPQAEPALLAAVTEAIQARLTVITGSRDDLPLGQPMRRPGFGFALAGDATGLDFGALWPVPCAPVPALAAAGFAQVARVVLSPAGCPVISVRMFVPGLGMRGRARRE